MKWKELDQDPRKIVESITVKPNVKAESAKAFKEAQTQDGARYLLPRIEAIHAGTTRNSTRYPAEKLRGSEELKSGVYSWLNPYPKPVIHNHDVQTEATGRVQTASFSEYTTAGRPGIIVVPKITQEKAIEDILGGRLLTVSIGATTDAAICSVCGTNIIEEGFCGHWKGEEYDGVKAEWIVGNVWFDELSWVNVPADQDAMIIDGGEPVSTAEAFANRGGEVINLSKNSTEWLVAPETALAEGLTTKEEKGDSTLTEEQIKKLQNDLKEAQEAKADLETKLSESKSKVEEAEGKVTEAEEAKATAESTLAEKEAELEEANNKVSDLTEEVEGLKDEKKDLEESLKDEKEARDQAVQENANLASQMHQAVAERVVDLRLSLGKESKEDREDAIKRYIERSTESLKDSLSDLLTEAEKAPAGTRQVEQVDNPASNNDGKDNPKDKTTEYSNEEVLTHLFSGPAFRKQK